MAGLSRHTRLAVLFTGGLIAATSGAVAARVSLDQAGAGPITVFLLNATYWAVWTLLAFPVLGLGRRWPLVPGRRVHAFVVHACGSVGFGAFHLGLMILLAVAVERMASGVSWSEAWALHGPLTRLHVEWEITTYWALVGLAHALTFAEEARDRARTAAHLEAELARAQLLTLQQQLQPHFLFNTLQSISALIRTQPAAADRMLDQLAELLRLSLRAGQTMEVPLAQELRHTQAYLDIARTNMGARLRVSIEVPDSLLAAAVPALLLQPLAENAIRHGLAPRVSGGTLTITGRLRDGSLELSVADDGVGMDPASVTGGIGTSSTRQRLAQLYGDRQSFTLRRNADGGVTVTVRLPYRPIAGTAVLVQAVGA